MDRITLPKWLQYGEYLLTLLCIFSIVLATLMFSFKTSSQKPLAENVPIYWQMENTQWPSFEWTPISSNQLQKRVFDWLFAPGRELHSQHSANASHAKNAGHQGSYSLSLVLPADDLTPLWQLPKTIPTWPGWKMVEATGVQNGSEWRISLRWEQVTENLPQTSTIENIWRNLRGVHTTQFQPALWQETPLSNAAFNQRTTVKEQASTPPAYMVGFIAAEYTAGAWLQASAIKEMSTDQQLFFLSVEATWEGWQLQKTPQHVFYLNKGKHRWQLNKCQYQNPCLL